MCLKIFLIYIYFVLCCVYEILVMSVKLLVPRLHPLSIRVAVESGDETVLSTDHSHMLWNGLQLVMYIHVHAVAHCCFYIT